jgi:dipeptidyl aminopeptidase/acylaminoacyl peptidase
MLKEVKNINYYQNLYMDLFLPEQEHFFTIVYFHGGGLVEGDKGDSHQFVKHLTKLGFAVSTANYSLITEKRFPECVKDAARAIKFIKDNINQYGKSKGVIVMGQSAGAYLTLMLCLNKNYLKEVGIDNNEIVGWISDAGQPTTHFNILKYERGLNPLLQRIDEAAPLYFVDQNTNFSHLLLIVYESDLPNRLEQNQLLLKTIKTFNKDIDVELKILHGEHCHGSGQLDEDNEYGVVKLVKEWMKRL